MKYQENLPDGENCSATEDGRCSIIGGLGWLTIYQGYCGCRLSILAGFGCSDLVESDPTLIM